MLYLLCISLIYFLLCLMITIRTQLSVFIIISPALVGEAIAMHSLCLLLLLLLLLALLAGSRGGGFAPGCSSWL